MLRHLRKNLWRMKKLKTSAKHLNQVARAPKESGIGHPKELERKKKNCRVENQAKYRKLAEEIPRQMFSLQHHSRC